MAILIRNLEWYTPIAAHLPDLELVPNAAGDPYLVHPNGWQCAAWSARWSRAEFHVSPSTAARAQGAPGSDAATPTGALFYMPAPVITVDVNRPPHKIAGEITRRLVPPANTWIQEYHAWRSDWEARQRLTADILQMIVTVGHGSPSSTGASIAHGSNGLISWSATVNPRHHTVNLTAANLPYEEALALLEQIRRIQT